MTNVCRVTSASSHTQTNYSLSHASANSHNRTTCRCRSTKRHIYPLHTAVHSQVLLTSFVFSLSLCPPHAHPQATGSTTTHSQVRSHYAYHSFTALHQLLTSALTCSFAISAFRRHAHRRLDQPRLTAWGQRDSHLSEWRSSHSHVPATKGIVSSFSPVALVHCVWQCDRGPHRVCACTCAHVCVFMHTRVQSCDRVVSFLSTCALYSTNLSSLHPRTFFQMPFFNYIAPVLDVVLGLNTNLVLT